MTKLCDGCLRLDLEHNDFHGQMLFKGERITDERATKLATRRDPCPRCEEPKIDWAIVEVYNRSDSDRCLALALTCMDCFQVLSDGGTE